LEREDVLCDDFGFRLGKPGVAFLEIIPRFGQSMASDKPTSDQRKKQSNDHAIYSFGVRIYSLALDGVLLDEPPVGLVPNGVELVEAEVRKHSGE
jgi:hypothetical protein